MLAPPYASKHEAHWQENLGVKMARKIQAAIVPRLKCYELWAIGRRWKWIEEIKLVTLGIN
jgi:hypothetical protein